MDTPTPHPQPIPTTPEQQVQQLNGLVGVVDDFGTAANTLFRRIYNSLTRRQKSKILVDTEALRRAQAHARALQIRVKTQNIEIARLTAILAAIDEGVVMQDTEGRIILMNEAARRIIGGTRAFWDSPLGQLFRKKIQETVAYTPELQIQPLGKPERVTVNNQVIGASVALVYSGRGEVLGTLLVLRDIYDDELPDRLKNSFITQMSHELLTPLTSIKGFSDLLLSVPDGRPINRQFLEKISSNVAIMNRMIVELLDISEISEGSFSVRKQPVQLDEQVCTVLQGLEPRIRKAGVKTSLMVVNHRNIGVLGDAARLQWALGHLIDNAINYTPTGGEIIIQIGQVRDNHLHIKISDSGTGISSRDLPRIFDRFYRGEARTKDGKLVDPRGLGQGLFVAKAVIEAHGGYISVASLPGEGSTFTVTLPVQIDEI